MTDRKEALERLIEAVEAGKYDAEPGGAFMPRYRGFAELMDAGTGALPQVGLLSLAWRAHEGSLDAAKALHEAVLPRWSYEVRPGSVRILHPKRYDLDVSEDSTTDARAWLIAILCALVVEMDE